MNIEYARAMRRLNQHRIRVEVARRRFERRRDERSAQALRRSRADLVRAATEGRAPTPG